MTISYDSAVATEAEGGLRATAAQIDLALQELSGHVTALCSGWEGDERVAYQDIQRRWDSAAREIHEILTRITLALGANTEAVTRMRAQVRATLAG
ncbi:WXG100 family type VII secretion target [Mobilicoccus massiliensis]|uniref:WXG100 family type VII secretion target n=1 Tax=Mobilicoccus massiliensis TaxID=1522310 RepID=UPI0006932F98|nr:WXG100 family type VII secretion target [Mobilicoccus massiliensis]